MFDIIFEAKNDGVCSSVRLHITVQAENLERAKAKAGTYLKRAKIVGTYDIGEAPEIPEELNVSGVANFQNIPHTDRIIGLEKPKEEKYLSDGLGE